LALVFQSIGNDVPDVLVGREMRASGLDMDLTSAFPLKGKGVPHFLPVNAGMPDHRVKTREPDHVMIPRAWKPQCQKSLPTLGRKKREIER